MRINLNSNKASGSKRESNFLMSINISLAQINSIYELSKERVAILC